MSVRVAVSIGHGENTFDERGSKGVVYYENGKRKVFEEHDDFNAHVGQMVAVELKRHDIDVLLVQQPFKDDVSLRKRVNMANDWGAHLYWSIHANASSSEKAHGACAWYANVSDTSRKLAVMWAKNMSNAGFEIHGSGTHASDQDPTTWQIRMFELWETKMPAVLTENGFFTNPHERRLMLQDEHREKVATVHVKTILDHFGIAYKPKETLKSKWQLEVEQAKQKAIAKGVSSGEHLDQAPTRAQLLVMLDRAGILD